MVFTIITQVPHIQFENNYFSYEPYIREMKIWEKYCTKLVVIAPLSKEKIKSIDDKYTHTNIEFIELKSFNFKTPLAIFKSLYIVFYNFFKIISNCSKSDHLHIRCPGNIGLLGCIAQLFFPKKTKTVKYAGNWFAGNKQPYSYQFQKYILKNTFLTKNCNVLVYGQPKNTSKNIMPFFTATYLEKDKIFISPRILSDTIKFIFVGTLSQGKRPMYAIELIKNLVEKSQKVSLHFYGEGVEKENLLKFCKQNNLEKYVFFKGNQPQDIIKNAYQESHFLILPSLSEGWPKVVAEAMFWSCLPIATAVSCIPDMLDNENRGLLLDLDLKKDIAKIIDLITNQELYNNKANLAQTWSRIYTLDYFESRIKLLLQQ